MMTEYEILLGGFLSFIALLTLALLALQEHAHEVAIKQLNNRLDAADDALFMYEMEQQLQAGRISRLRSRVSTLERVSGANIEAH
jgi:Mg2+ and Co2+ transporter CorA